MTKSLKKMKMGDFDHPLGSTFHICYRWYIKVSRSSVIEFQTFLQIAKTLKKALQMEDSEPHIRVTKYQIKNPTFTKVQIDSYVYYSNSESC